MMRFLTPVLNRLFKPKTTMDLQNRHDLDPISAALDAAIGEHTRTHEAEASGYERRLRETIDAIDDVFHKLGKHDARD